ncbi:hypothetical protein BU16DRAFT_556595 [Lophium mytilinum]|uniref:Uncharacterized protein n=1 Tax=Lophium mytilinum TaxID=390894 RepID=A0A6A6R6V9_9PEZI|nr:hypothetical protein BU16DRAFT_556595 [Lophium mytilinum]
MANASVCFFPNNFTTGDDQPTKFVPCDPSAPVSACCAVGEACTVSGLCYSGLGSIYRGACTDRNWGDSCPLLCTQDNHGPNAGLQDGVQWLSNCGAPSDNFVCGGNPGCDNSSLVFIDAVAPILQVNITGNFTKSQAFSSLSSTPASFCY